jgi:hypothetical protein
VTVCRLPPCLSSSNAQLFRGEAPRRGIAEDRGALLKAATVPGLRAVLLAGRLSARVACRSPQVPGGSIWQPARPSHATLSQGPGPRAGGLAGIPEQRIRAAGLSSYSLLRDPATWHSRCSGKAPRSILLSSLRTYRFTCLLERSYDPPSHPKTPHLKRGRGAESNPNPFPVLACWLAVGRYA